MKLKKLISAIAALTIVFSVTSCGEKENGTEADDYLKTMTIYNGAEIDIVNEKLRHYRRNGLSVYAKLYKIR